MTSLLRRTAFLIAVSATLLTACGDDAPTTATTPGAGQTDSTDATVTIDQGAFHPPELTVAAGTTVTFTNEDIGAHTVTAADGEAMRYDSDILPAGSTFTQTYDEPGVYAYVCTLHPTMQGTVTVEAT